MKEAISIEKALEVNGHLVQPVVGDSMLPMLRERKDAVRLVKANGKLKKFDLPLYRRPNGQLVLHRIIKVKRDHYVTCGDNRIEKEKVPFDWIIAVAEGYYKDGTYIPADDEAYLQYVDTHCKNLHRRKVIQGVRLPYGWSVFAKLYRMAITDTVERISIPDDFNWKSFTDLCKKQSVMASMYPALAVQLCPDDIVKQFRDAYNMSMRRHILFDREREIILSALEKQGIKYMCLKGVHTKELYPKAPMREFADNDILFDKGKVSDVEQIMYSLGYGEKDSRIAHDSYLKEPIYNFEMHKCLFSDNKQKCFERVWDNAELINGTNFGYIMSNEDFYLHNLLHLYKHYSDSGCGIRLYADMWLIRKSLGDNNSPNLRKSITELGMEDFEKETLEFCYDLFEGDISNINDEIASRIFSGGVFGSEKLKVENGIKQNGNSIKYLFVRLFMPYEKMCERYEVLNKAPFLLPFFWCVRILVIFFSAERIGRFKRELGFVKKHNR